MPCTDIRCHSRNDEDRFAIAGILRYRIAALDKIRSQILNPTVSFCDLARSGSVTPDLADCVSMYSVPKLLLSLEAYPDFEGC